VPAGAEPRKNGPIVLAKITKNSVANLFRYGSACPARCMRAALNPGFQSGASGLTMRSVISLGLKMPVEVCFPPALRKVLPSTAKRWQVHTDPLPSYCWRARARRRAEWWHSPVDSTLSLSLNRYAWLPSTQAAGTFDTASSKQAAEVYGVKVEQNRQSRPHRAVQTSSSYFGECIGCRLRWVVVTAGLR
jgi:hypothetical protein